MSIKEFAELLFVLFLLFLLLGIIGLFYFAELEILDLSFSLGIGYACSIVMLLLGLGYSRVAYVRQITKGRWHVFIEGILSVQMVFATFGILWAVTILTLVKVLHLYPLVALPLGLIGPAIVFPIPHYSNVLLDKIFGEPVPPPDRQFRVNNRTSPGRLSC